MNNKLHDKQSVIDMINEGQNLILAGHENILKELPKGSWIAGTIPYFMDIEGGCSTADKIFVTQLPDCVVSSNINAYSADTVKNVYTDGPSNGFGIIIVPATSATHAAFALDSHTYSGFAMHPLIGWISGVFLEDLGKITPKVFDGTTGTVMEDGAVVMNIELPANKIADIDIINVFQQGDGDTITFPTDGFSAKDVYINGEKTNFVDYLTTNEIDLKLPLVADMYGAMINTSFQSLNEEEKQADLYAPVFKGVPYKIAKPTENYEKDFTSRIPTDANNVFFSCNCILNYLYAELEGKQTGKFTGPITFGEIAYQLLNQTLAYITIEDI